MTADAVRLRQAERVRLIASRQALGVAERARFVACITAHLDAWLTEVTGRTIGLYWPMRGEPDLRRWMTCLHRRGARCALPVVVARDAPMVYRPWRPGTTLQPGVLDIPVPVEGEPVQPSIVMSPLLGFDACGYRLGYGGGFFDRTLASYRHEITAVGVGFEVSRLPTVWPQPHDIPMHAIVTEAGLQWVGGVPRRPGASGPAPDRLP